MIDLAPRAVLASVRDTVRHVLSGRRRSTKYLSERIVVKATARHKPKRRAGTVEVVVTIGRPNYAERKFIRDAKRSGEGFPVKRVQFKEWK